MTDRSPDRLRILVADDSELQLQYEQTILADIALEFIVARNGEDAVNAARVHRPDLILLDIVMPIMTGIEAAERIRADPQTARIPIIMVTSQTDADDMENAFVGGCNDYVTKPVDAGELFAKIASLTGVARGM